MQAKRTKLDFTNQHFFVGIDIHKRNWTVTIFNSGLSLGSFVMDSDPAVLIKHLNTHYPNGTYHSFYEAGFSGFYADRILRTGNIDNIIVNPAKVPSQPQDKIRKTDKIDSQKLARELMNGSLQKHKMYIPTIEEEGFRSLCRLRIQRTRDKARVKIQIKSLLDFLGVSIASKAGANTWGTGFVNYLANLSLPDKSAEHTLHLSVSYLGQIQSHLRCINKEIKEAVRQDPAKDQIIHLLCSIPGIGFATAVILYAELMNIERFSNVEKLIQHVGLTPDIRSSGDTTKVLGITALYMRYVRNILIESAWSAVRKDPALTESYGNLVKRMSKPEAIIKIAVKLLRRVAYVWSQKKEYVCAVVA
jgi:transposase